MPTPPATPTTLLTVDDLSVEFRTRRHTTQAVHGLSFAIAPSETVAIVGESGSGKSVTALSIMRLIAQEGGTITRGRIAFTRPNGETVDLTTCPETTIRQIRAGRSP